MVGGGGWVGKVIRMIGGREIGNGGMGIWNGKRGREGREEWEKRGGGRGGEWEEWEWKCTRREDSKGRREFPFYSSFPFLLPPSHSLSGGFRGSSLGSLEHPFLKLATYQQTLTELADTHPSSLELRSAVQSRQIAQT